MIATKLQRLYRFFWGRATQLYTESMFMSFSHTMLVYYCYQIINESYWLCDNAQNSEDPINLDVKF